MDSSYEVQFAGLVEAATAAADAHQRDLGKRKRGEEHAYIPVPANEIASSEPPSKTPTLSNSAAILFREPSEKSKKYSRPPLGKVFTSLQLAPEAFLRLQHAAKAYMLNDDFPERKDVVGHKKLANNNDVAKLKLYECVEEFLQQDGVGEQYFGHTSHEETADAQPRTFFWPEDRNKIVKLLMPLLRKMVTNERQRIYAAETRKQEPRRTEEGSQKKSSVSVERETARSSAEFVCSSLPLRYFVRLRQIQGSLPERGGLPGPSDSHDLPAKSATPNRVTDLTCRHPRLIHPYKTLKTSRRPCYLFLPIPSLLKRVQLC